MDEQTKQPLVIGGVVASGSFLLLVLGYYIYSIVSASRATFTGILVVLGVSIVVGAIAGGVAFAMNRN